MQWTSYSWMHLHLATTAFYMFYRQNNYIIQAYWNQQYLDYIYCIYSSFYYNDQLNHNLHMWELLIWHLEYTPFSFALLQLFTSFRISLIFDTLDFSIDNFFVLHLDTKSLITKEKKFYNVISFLIKYAQCSVRLPTGSQAVKTWQRVNKYFTQYDGNEWNQRKKMF